MCSLMFLLPKSISQLWWLLFPLDISYKELNFGLYAAYLVVSRMLLPRIALPFPTYNAVTALFVWDQGYYIVRIEIKRCKESCFDAQIELCGQCEALSSVFSIVLRTPTHAPPQDCTAISCFQTYYRNCLFFLSSFFAENWQKGENTKLL